MPRAYRKGLSRERVLDAALHIVSKRGLDALTIRALAAKLRVTPMAVYRHFQDKEDLIHGLLEQIVDQARPLEHREIDGQAWLVTTFTRMRDALRRHPGILPLLGTAASYGPVTLQVLEGTLGRLVEMGLSPSEAIFTFHRLMSYTIGSVVLEMATMTTTRDRQKFLRRLHTSLVSLPITASLGKDLATLVEGLQFEAGLRAILATMTASL